MLWNLRNSECHALAARQAGSSATTEDCSAVAPRQPGAPNFAACCAEGGGSISGCSCANPSHVFLASQARPTDDELWDQTLRERDRYHEVADELAAHIERITGVEIGEHSSLNCPWQNAIEAAESYTPAQGIKPALSPYDPGLLSDIGGGDTDWWVNYVRAELARAHAFYQRQADQAGEGTHG